MPSESRTSELAAHELDDRLRALARTPLLLVACDYDGTLAELVPDPARAVPSAKAMKALADLAAIDWTTTAIVSGRPHADLAKFLAEHPMDLVVGSHGAEWQSSGVRLTHQQRERLGQLNAMVASMGQIYDGVHSEYKPAGVTVHVRGVDRAVADSAINVAVDVFGDLPGVTVRHGSEVVEFMVVNANKGDAIRRARQMVGATGILFVGDDITDEDAFVSMTDADVSVKVGRGQTAAKYRIAGVNASADMLERLAALRTQWAKARSLVALETCAVLSDQRTMAVVSPPATSGAAALPGARISWLCMPRIDSGAIFAELVGGRDAGVFDIAPVEASPSSPAIMKYDGDSFVLTTSWPGLTVTDYLDASGGRAYQKAGRCDLIRVLEGTAPARIEFAPRLDFGRIPTRLRIRENNAGMEIEGSNDPIVLRCSSGAGGGAGEGAGGGAPMEWTITRHGMHDTAHAIVNPSAGPIVLELRYGSANVKPGADAEPDRREQNRRFWSGWAAALKLPKARPELVKRSALVIKALSHGPTGAIAAAATTSLPELIGGVRNWDYRYCWPRDAAHSAAALVRLGNTGHALKLLDWMLEVVDQCQTPDRLHPIYTVSGGHLPPEADLAHLCGYADSRPVRIGNAAANQVQLDVFGPIVDLVALLAERGAPIAPDHWRLVRAMVRAVQTRWSEPDHGIWEMRVERRHHVHSKVMCWHTVSRALVVEEAVCGSQNAEWVALREAIAADVLSRGWNAKVGAFTGAYDHAYLDAAVLLIGQTGLLAAADERWVATVTLIDKELRDGHTVRRYRIDDGLPGDEGGMHICTGWLIEALLSIGRRNDALALFDHLAGLMRGPGILTEQYDSKHGHCVGNLAQAYSHLAFINAALAIDRAEGTTDGAKS